MLKIFNCKSVLIVLYILAKNKTEKKIGRTKKYKKHSLKYIQKIKIQKIIKGKSKIKQTNKKTNSKQK